MNNRLGGWQQNLLGTASGLVLVRYVLSSMPVHVIASARLPQSVIAALERRFSLFLWGTGRRH